MSFTWECPLCQEFEGRFVRQTKIGIQVATAEHILHMHESPAALRAVDRARLECTETSCSLGHRKFYDKDLGQIPKLTEYDRKFLAGVKIKLE